MATLTPHTFAQRWGESTLSERSSYQQHFLDLCEMMGAPKPAETDPAGKFYTFEKGVEKTGGGKGFADVWYKDHFAIEYKGKHKDLSTAYQQLLQYREALENPPVLMVTDTERYEIHTNFTGTVSRVYAFTNSELPEPENLRLLQAMFEDPYSLRPTRTVESVTEEAAGKFAQIADGLRGRGVDPQEAAHFLNKILFCLFAEDVGQLLPKGLFTRVVERTRREPERFASYIGGLFTAMRDGGDFLLEDIPRFNGGLYEIGDVVPLTSGELKILLEAARLDWGSVEPAIFGTLFERSLDPAQRARLGAHYTSTDDILNIVEPVLMAPLRREWVQVRSKTEAEAAKAGEQTGRKATNTLRRTEGELVAFAEKLRRVRVLDPACGCGSGNFLYVSLKELLDLEKEVSTFVGEIGLTPFFPGVNPEQLYGIEMNPYAHELAQVVIWIGYLQWMIDNGFGSPGEPILGPMTNIVEMDAILAHTEDGKPREPEWPEAGVIVGNPPFLGDKRMRAELGDAYVNDLRRLYEGRVGGGADLVAYWFEKVREAITRGKIRRAGLLATNGIRFGANREILKRIKGTGDIFFAESDRPWILDGAAVRVSMVGFDDGEEKARLLDGQAVQQINSDLTSLVDVTGAKPLSENKGTCFLGMMKAGPFDIDADTAHEMLEAPPNPNGRPNSHVVKPRLGGLDVTRRPRNTWIIDFGVDMSEEEASLYEVPFEYVKEHVKPLRDKNRRKRTRERWWIHGEARPGLRRALQGLNRCIVTPEVAKHRLFVWMDTDTIPDHTLHVVAREDDYSFGVLHSRAHELWSLSVGNFMGYGNDPRYNSSRTFDTFPFPHPPTEEQRDAISAAARRLDELRRSWLNPEGTWEAELKKRTLTNLYNQRPTWLENAHAALDEAVFAAYGWPLDITDEEILQHLLALNSERSKPA